MSKKTNDIQRQYYKDLARRIWAQNASLIHRIDHGSDFVVIGDLIDSVTKNDSLDHTINVLKLALDRLGKIKKNSEEKDDYFDVVRMMSFSYEISGLINELHKGCCLK